MKVLQNACAPSGRTVDWRRIEWQKVYQTTRRLQARIVKATQEGRWGKVKALQRLLTHSYSGKALAVRRVTENQGKRTPGVDGITWSTPEAKSNAVLSLRQRGYQTMPLRRIYIPKSKGGRRPISIPAMTDRAMQALYLLALQPVAETTADSHSYGFRTGRSTADAKMNCFTQLSRKDIRTMGSRRGHQRLLRQHQSFLAVRQHPHGQINAREMAEGGFHGTGVLQPDEGRDSPRRDHLAGTGKHGSGRATTAAQKNLPRVIEDKSGSNGGCKSQGQLRQVRGRLCATQSRTEDEGRPLGAALQGEAPNHPKLLWLRAMVVSVGEKARRDLVR